MVKPTSDICLAFFSLSSYIHLFYFPSVCLCLCLCLCLSLDLVFYASVKHNKDNIDARKQIQKHVGIFFPFRPCILFCMVSWLLFHMSTLVSMSICFVLYFGLRVSAVNKRCCYAVCLTTENSLVYTTVYFCVSQSNTI